MKKFLLIGPSGIGKSTALKKLSEDTALDIFDLDDLIKENVKATSLSNYFSEFGNQNFFSKSREVIERLQTNKNSLIAVGAGSIDFIDGHSWYENQNTITLIGDPDVIYTRSDRQKFHPTVEVYKTREFSQARQKLYTNSKYPIDVTYLTPEQVANKISEIIKNNT